MFKRKLLLGALLVVVTMVFSLGLVHAQVKEIRLGTLTGPPVEPVATMLVEQFKKLHPDVEVKLEVQTGDLAQSYAAQAAAKTLPDIIFTADLFVVPFAQQKITIDMQPLADADKSFDISDVYENMLNLSRVNGKGLYMIPSSFDVVTVYYNKTMFEAAGAPTPKAEWTWDDFIAACKTIKEKTGNYCLTKDGWNWWAWYVPWISGYGGKILSDDGKTVLLSSDEAIAGLDAYTDLWKKHDIAQPLDSDVGGNCFQVGKCATHLFIPAMMNTMRSIDPQPFEWDVQVIPSLPKGKFTGMGTFGFAISADAKDQALAWDFIKGMLSKETQKAITLNYAGNPLLKSLANDPDILALKPPPTNIRAFTENGKNGITPTYFPGDCGSLYAGKINEEINTAMEASVRGSSSVKDAFTAANDAIQACLDGK
jgi:multiple sugar transport system substrate-binding protein